MTVSASPAPGGAELLRDSRPARHGSGGIGTIAVALLWMKLFPALWNADRIG